MPKSPLRPEEEYQRVLDTDIREDISMDPPSAFTWYISNLVSRVFAFLFGWDGKKPVRVKVSPSGEVYTRSKSVSYSHNATYAGTITGTTPAEYTFPQVCSRVDVWVWDTDAYISRSLDGYVWDTEILVPAGTFYSFDADTYAIRVRPVTSTLTTRYQIVAWY